MSYIENMVEANDFFSQLSPRDQHIELRHQLLEQTDFMMNESKCMNINEFKIWINTYPFIREYFRQALNPRLITFENGEKYKQKSASKRKSGFGLCIQANQKTYKDYVFDELFSTRLKSGELYKLGKNTGSMQERWYVIRDRAFFEFDGPDDNKEPKKVISLRGL